MIDWATTASLATAGATLVLAAGTFASVRSANRAARTAERALLAGLRPVLAPSRLEDPADKIMWADTTGPSSGGGIAVLQGCSPRLDYRPGQPHADVDQFRRQGRDLYIPGQRHRLLAGGRTGCRRRRLRGPGRRHQERQRFVIEVLYSDHEGG
jgi:hypothetical protein